MGGDMDTDITTEVEKYVVFYYGGGSRDKRPYKYRATISIYNSVGQFGTLHFHDNNDDLPDTDEMGEGGILKAHFVIRDFTNILDILRNEKPLFFHQFAHWPTMGVVATSKEMVGEGEIPS